MVASQLFGSDDPSQGETFGRGNRSASDVVMYSATDIEDAALSEPSVPHSNLISTAVVPKENVLITTILQYSDAANGQVQLYYPFMYYYSSSNGAEFVAEGNEIHSSDG